VLRVKSGATPAELPMALKETLPHLPAETALAIVCAGQTCLPPTSDPAQLRSLLEDGAAGVAS
jgi:hypothetical protein